VSRAWRALSPVLAGAPLLGEGGGRWLISPALCAVRRACAWDRAADMAGDRLHRILAELSAGGADAWSSARLCRGCVKIIGVDGAGVMLMSGDIPRGSLCSTNEVSHLIEELQYTLGEGPCTSTPTSRTGS
jgi:hypothetical protein